MKGHKNDNSFLFWALAKRNFMNKQIILNIIICFNCQALICSTANDNTKDTRLNIGIGTTPKYFKEYNSVSLSLGLIIDNNFSITEYRYLHSSEVSLIEQQNYPISSINAFSVLYGKSILVKNKLLRISRCIGISYILNVCRGKWIPGYESYDYKLKLMHAIGLPIEFQFFHFKPDNPNSGIGLNLFANINTFRHYWGFLLEFHWSRQK